MNTLQRFKAAAIIALAAATATPGNAEPALDFSPSPNDPAAWYDDAKYGMFIHWGLYSQLARGEWVMLQEEIPLAEYEDVAAHFNPVKFDADAWVRVAKNAGMKFIVITSKHHDGFALFKSKVSDFNLVDATPFKRDAIRELKDACDRHGIKLGLYYSHAQDWYHLGGIAQNRAWDDRQIGADDKADMDTYLDSISLPQVREIVTQYDPFLIWYDTPFRISNERAREFTQAARQLNPDILINSRVRYNGRNTKNLERTRRDELADLGVSYLSYRDREIPESSPWPYWETCMTLNHSWGYTEDDHHWKTPKRVIQQLVEVVNKGGTFLLNVGPTGEGEIPADSIRILAEAGDWLKVNGKAVYGANPSTYRGTGTPCPDSLELAKAQARKAAQTGAGKKKKVEAEILYDWLATENHGNLYLHLFDWPQESTFTLHDFTDRAAKVYLLDQPDTPLAFDHTDKTLTINLPDHPSNAIASVICIERAE